jgi:hypothetical protein
MPLNISNITCSSQESLHNRNLVYCVRVMSVGCTGGKVELHFNPGAARTIYQYMGAKLKIYDALSSVPSVRINIQNLALCSRSVHTCYIHFSKMVEVTCLYSLSELLL